MLSGICMSISLRIVLGFVLLTVLTALCGLVGYSGINKLSESLKFVTGPAWSAADGAMEGTIGVGAELLAISEVVSGSEIFDAGIIRIDESAAMADEAFGRMQASGLIETSELAEFEVKKKEFVQARNQFLDSFKHFTAADSNLNTNFFKFQQLMELAEELGDSQVEALEQNPDQSVSWNNGLSERWTAADGGMEAQIGMLQRIYFYKRLVAGEAEEQALQNLADALDFLSGSISEITQHPLFLSTIVEASIARDISFSNALSTAFEQHKTDFSESIEAYRQLTVSKVEFDALASELLAIVEVLEEVGDGQVEGQLEVVNATVDQALLMLLLSTLASIAIAGVGGFLIVQSIRKPIQQAVSLARAVGEGDLSFEVTSNSNNEMGTLIKALNQVVRSMRSAMNSEKVDWTEVASFFGEMRSKLDRVMSMIEGTPSALIMANKDLMIEYSNPATAALFKQLSGSFDIPGNLLEGALLTDLHPELAKVKAQLQSPATLPYKTVLPVGDNYVEATVEPIFDNVNEYIGPMLSMSLVTDRVVNERLVQENIDKERAQAEVLKSNVDALLDVVNAAAAGDLTRSIPELGSDGIGQMAKALNQFMRTLRKSFETISNNACVLSDSSERLSLVSESLSTVSEQNASQAGVVAKAADEVNISVSSVATATEQMGASIKEIARNTTKASEVADQAVKITKQTDAMVRKLSESSARIGGVIKVITSIAEQTNLLALNATIEAARAGDAGKGFAVVANEVKELAKETAKATEEISQIVIAIQTHSGSAVGAIGEIDAIVDQINEIQTIIAGAVEEQSATTGEINRSIVVTSRGSTEIAENITDVASGARQTLDGAKDTRKSANELAASASELHKLVNYFKFAA